MPHFGQFPGRLLRTSGCMGQVYSVATGTVGTIGTSAMPHFGHEPGPSRTISGCIGQVYFTAAGAGCLAAGAFCAYFSGSAWNFAAQCLQQKKYFLPSCSTVAPAFAGSTVMPQTGSIAMINHPSFEGRHRILTRAKSMNEVGLPYTESSSAGRE